MDHPRDPAPRTSESRSAGATLLCTVRGCGRPLAPEAGTLRCALGHAFDRARRGWVNLLQPQDRRSRAPGNSRDAALARRRLVTMAGLEAPLHDRLVAALDSPRAGGTRGEALPVLDVGCGEGSVLAALAARRSIVAHGVDLSADAVDLAAAALPAGVWVVANADRGLPFADGSFDLALSLLARRPADELARVLRRDWHAPGGGSRTGRPRRAAPGGAGRGEPRGGWTPSGPSSPGSSSSSGTSASPGRSSSTAPASPTCSRRATAERATASGSASPQSSGSP